MGMILMLPQFGHSFGLRSKIDEAAKPSINKPEASNSSPHEWQRNSYRVFLSSEG
jgi:hypothetical protein